MFIEEITPKDKELLTRITSKDFPSKEFLNKKEYTIEQSDIDISNAAEVLRPLTHPDIYNTYISLLSEKNNSYGNHTWNVLGMKYMYGILFAKYLRYVECRSFDSLVDSFGYCVISLAYYINNSGKDEVYNRIVGYFHNKYDNLNGQYIPEIYIDVCGLFSNYYKNLWQEGNFAQKTDVLYFILNLVLYMGQEYQNPNYKLGQHF